MKLTNVKNFLGLNLFMCVRAAHKALFLLQVSTEYSRRSDSEWLKEIIFSFFDFVNTPFSIPFYSIIKIESKK